MFVTSIDNDRKRQNLKISGELQMGPTGELAAGELKFYMETDHFKTLD